jgi:hypothetical protein
MNRAEQISTEPLDCGNCLLAQHGRLCQPATEAILKAAMNQDPTVDIGLSDRVETAESLLVSLKYSKAARSAGERACRNYQAEYNQTTAASILSIMV